MTTPSALLPGELRMRGVLDRAGRPELLCQAGEGISATTVELIRTYFIERRFNHTHLVERDKGPEASFLEMLQSRKYDIASLRFRIFLKSAQRAIPRVRLITLRPGVLVCRWARVQHDSPDVCSAWQWPCRKADSNMLMRLLSSPSFARMDQILSSSRWGGLLDELVDAGFDKRTLRFEVRSLKPVDAKDRTPSQQKAAVPYVVDSTAMPRLKRRCPICAAQAGAPCSEPIVDDDEGRCAEWAHQVHTGRLA